jgi:protease-4
VGLDRALVLGVGLRPTGTDLVTFGLDAMVPEAGGTRWRLGARAWVPSFGFLRAEGAYDVNRGAADTWRASLGVEFYLGRHSGALTGTVGSGSTVGFGASAGWDEQRGRGLPFGSLVVKVELDDSPTPRAFGRLLWRLETLRRDPSVRGVLFAPRANLGGLAEAEELREAFQGLRRAGVRVSCHLTDASGGTWYACAGMDRVSVDLVGGVRLSGVRASHFYLGPLLWRLGVRTDFVRIGDWKSAPEQFTLGGSTRPAREQEERLLDDLYVQLTRAVAAMRRMPEPQARETVDAGPFTARAARQRDLVDAVGTLEQAERAARVSAGGARVVDLDDYAPLQPRRWSPGPAVAVLYIDGDIVDGESSDLPGVGLHLVGDRTVVEAVEAAAADPRIGALVVRVDSGGGSATASELMWRALHAAARRKPVVASFGRVAASGGYYVGVAARELYADAATVTGSIGIFYGKADIAQLLQRAEVGVELRRRGAHADLESVFRPYTDDERALLGRAMGELYGTFVARVAAGRRRTPAEIDRVAQGHLWSGARAVDLGLVDHTGGLLAAVRRARELADLPEEHELVELPVAPGGVLRELARTFLDEPSTPGIARALATSELRAPFAWLVSVALQRGGALAMIDWPLALP